MPRPTIKEEKRVFYYDIAFLHSILAEPYLKIFREKGGQACFKELCEEYEDRVHLDGGRSTEYFAESSAGTEDKIIQNNEFAMVYNIYMGYFHLLGRNRGNSYRCHYCRRLIDVSNLKLDPSVNDCVCSICIGPEAYAKL
jgi:hypothetical protein